MTDTRTAAAEVERLRAIIRDLLPWVIAPGAGPARDLAGSTEAIRDVMARAAQALRTR